MVEENTNTGTPYNFFSPLKGINLTSLKDISKGLFPGLQNASQTLANYKMIRPALFRLPLGFYISTGIAITLFVSNVLTWFGVYQTPENESNELNETEVSDYQKARTKASEKICNENNTYAIWSWLGYINALAVNSTGMFCGVLATFQAFGFYAPMPSLIVGILGFVSGYYAAYEMTKEFSLAGLKEYLTDQALQNAQQELIIRDHQEHVIHRNKESFLNVQLANLGLENLMGNKMAYGCAILVSLIFAFFQYSIAHQFVIMSIRFVPVILKIRTLEFAAHTFGLFSAVVTFLVLLPMNYLSVIKKADTQPTQLPEDKAVQLKPDSNQPEEKLENDLFKFSDAANISFYVTLASTVANLSYAIFTQFACYFSFTTSFTATAMMIVPCVPVFSGFIDNGRVWQQDKFEQLADSTTKFLSSFSPTRS